MELKVVISFLYGVSNTVGIHSMELKAIFGTGVEMAEVLSEESIQWN